jgi:uncharacterized membrane protein YjjP (DUF1212 family)
MALNEPASAIKRRSSYKYMYAAIFIAMTSITTVMMSIGGYISLDPLASFIASLFAGFAFLIFQITHVRFVVNSAQPGGRREPQPNLQ